MNNTDYKDAILPTRRKKSKSPFWLGLSIGFILGLTVSLGIAVYINYTHLPFSESSLTHTTVEQKIKSPHTTPLVQGVKLLNDTPAKPSASSYHFYDAMTKQEPGLVENTGTENNNIPHFPAYLVLAEYDNPTEADNNRAQVALLGIEAHIQTLQDGHKMKYRMRIGPLMSLEDIESFMEELKSANIHSTHIEYSS